MNRRLLIKTLTSLLAASSLYPFFVRSSDNSKHKIALSQWSFHRAIFGNSRDDYGWFIKTLHSDPDAVLRGSMDPRDIVVKARELDVSYVDLANTLWFGHAKDKSWLAEFARMARQEGIGFTCLMCDELGYLGSSDPAARASSLEKHKPWIEAAAFLGCTQFRVNAYGDGTYLSQLEQNAESLSKLADYIRQFNIELLVENHGHPSSNAAWLAMLMEKVNLPNVGVYTDLDNFFMGGWNHDPQRRYDRYQGLLDLAPYTRGVSAKTHAFDEKGNETTINYTRCLKVFKDAGFEGFYCAEYEGNALSEIDGSISTIKLLRKTLGALS